MWGWNPIVLTAIATTVAALTAIGGVIYAWLQIRTAKQARRVDRVLALHEEFSTGEIAAARSRFSEFMWRAGEAAFGIKDERWAEFKKGWCWQPTWTSLYPPSPGCRDEVASQCQRFLGTYPEDMPDASKTRPLYDLRQVLWCLERIYDACQHKKENLDKDLLVSLIGWHVVWWKLVTRRLNPQLGAILKPLDDLAGWVSKQGNDNYGNPKWMKGRDFDPHDDFIMERSVRYDNPNFRTISRLIDKRYSQSERDLKRLAVRSNRPTTDRSPSRRRL